MIASFSQRFIFLKTRKTGGTSVAIALSSVCGDGDVCSPLYGPDETMRQQAGCIASTAKYRGQKIHSHLTAVEVRGLFPDLWETACKISLERHPYEKVVSRAYWNIARAGNSPDADVATEIDHAISSGIIIDRDMYCIDGAPVFDVMLQHKSLQEDMTELADRLGVSLPKLPRAKSGFRTDRRPAHLILNDDQKRRIRELAAFEFETFGYLP